MENKDRTYIYIYIEFTSSEFFSSSDFFSEFPHQNFLHNQNFSPSQFLIRIFSSESEETSISSIRGADPEI